MYVCVCGLAHFNMPNLWMQTQLLENTIIKLRIWNAKLKNGNTKRGMATEKFSLNFVIRCTKLYTAFPVNAIGKCSYGIFLCFWALKFIKISNERVKQKQKTTMNLNNMEEKMHRNNSSFIFILHSNSSIIYWFPNTTIIPATSQWESKIKYRNRDEMNWKLLFMIFRPSYEENSYAKLSVPVEAI